MPLGSLLLYISPSPLTTFFFYYQQCVCFAVYNPEKMRKSLPQTLALNV